MWYDTLQLPKSLQQLKCDGEAGKLEEESNYFNIFISIFFFELGIGYKGG